MSRVYVYSLLGLVGRLGNQFWQVAATLNYSLKDPGSRAGLPSDWEYRPYVCLPDELFEPPQAGEEIIDVARLPEGPYFQALEYVDVVGDMLTGLYGPSLYGQQRYRERHGDRPGGHRTALHVRRTDYLENPERFPQLTPRYFHAAVESIRERHPETTVYVFSDDIHWCKDNTDTLGITDVPHEFIEGHVRPIPPRERTTPPDDILDLWLMAGCDSFVISNSTFSWWGAFLSASDDVFYPDVWYGNSAQHSEKMWEAFPDAWKQLPC